MIVEVTESSVEVAGRVHAESWRQSHKGFCSAEFVAKHTAQTQTEYLRREMAAGKRVYLLTDGEPVGIVSVWGDLIENLYVLPDRQNRGYGAELLKFAMAQCQGTPRLWILNNNAGAKRFYVRQGFTETGKRKMLKEPLQELEMVWSRLAEIRQAERDSHERAYAENTLFAAGSWLAKPVKTVLELLPRFQGYPDFRGLDLGCGVGRNAIPVARALQGRVDCVDILEGAIEKLRENAERYGVGAQVRRIVSAIDDYEIEKDGYDLILAVSALEHVDSEETFARKLAQMRSGARPGGIVCLVVNTGVRERDKASGAPVPPQFEVNFSEEALTVLLERVFAGWEIVKRTVVHQKYDIPRAFGTAELETDVVTWVGKKR